jgi:hypothetical protein
MELAAKRISVLLLLALLLVQGAFASVTIEISGDNATWKPINSSVYAGDIDLSSSVGLAQILNPTTTYYLRAKNDSTSWSYKSFTTLGDETLTGIILAFIIIIITFGVYGFFSNGSQKLLGYGLSLIELSIMTFILYLKELNESIASMLSMNFYIILIIIFGIGMTALIRYVLRLMDANDETGEENLKWGERR